MDAACLDAGEVLDAAREELQFGACEGGGGGDIVGDGGAGYRLSLFFLVVALLDVGEELLGWRIWRGIERHCCSEGLWAA